jgi:N-acetylglutamate synthase-like GNAT family acetyltransferase
MNVGVDQIIIEIASQQDLPEILTLLNSVNLPTEGVAENLAGFLTARNRDGRLVGTIGLERHGRIGLLRSAAVANDVQRSGLGSSLTVRLLEQAGKAGIDEVLLLTSTAREFFERRFGFVEADRDQYASDLSTSVEWNLPRCSSAVLLRYAVEAR